MKESEAKTKWCPHARQGICGTNTPVMNVDFDGNHFTNCIGSACMMWEGYSVRIEGKWKYNGEGTCGLITKDLES